MTALSQPSFRGAEETAMSGNEDLTVVTATSDHARVIADSMRAEDIWEASILGFTPMEALMMALDQPGSITLTILYLGAPLMMGGVRNTGRGTGTIWMLGTEIPREIRPRMLGVWRRQLKFLFYRFTELSNVIPAKRHDSMVMLQRLGFDISMKPLQYRGHIFLRFCMKRN